MTKRNASRKKRFLWTGKKVNRLKPLETTATTLFQKLVKKLKQWFASLHRILMKLEEKLLAILKKIAGTIRRYWECLMIPTEILILLLRKLKQQNLLSCNES